MVVFFFICRMTITVYFLCITVLWGAKVTFILTIQFYLAHINRITDINFFICKFKGEFEFIITTCETYVPMK